MASLLIDDQEVTVSLAAAEKIEALHGNVTVPRAAVVRHGWYRTAWRRFTA